MSENIQQSARAPGLNGANCLTAPNSKRRRITNGAEFKMALNPEGRNGATARRRNCQTAPDVASRRCAPFAILAPLGISRR
jgi:hypothetical protein